MSEKREELELVELGEVSEETKGAQTSGSEAGSPPNNKEV